MNTPAPEYTITVDQTGATLHWQGQTFAIEAEDLIDGGWEFEPRCDRDHCGDGDCPECSRCDGEAGASQSDLAEMLKRWHDDESGHAGPFKFCDHEPCKGMGQALWVRHG